MEFFKEAKAVRLRSHLNKYLVADDDQVSTRQSRNGSARKARWLVELVDSNPDVVRLKSCHGRYLTSSDEAFLLGMTGNKVRQTLQGNIKDWKIEWQPIRDGFQVRLKAFGGTYLRANGGTPPWRNSITHDSPHTSSTHSWVLWDVEALQIPENEPLNDYLSMVSSFSSVSDELSGLELGSPESIHSGYSPSPRLYSGHSPSPRLSMKKKIFQLQSNLSLPSTRTTAMDLFQNAKAVRLKSVHGKYLTAEEDEESVTQHRSGSSNNAKWTVEFVENSDNIIRLKSCYNKYLTASNKPFLLGMTGRKVLQTLPGRLDSSVEWEPIREGNSVKLKTRYGQFLRANGGLPPWRNSVTHDIPHRTATQDWVLWDVHVVEILVMSPATVAAPPVLVPESDSFASDSSSPSTLSINSASFSGPESNESLVSSPPKRSDGRLIYFHIANEYGEIDEGFEELCTTFKGNGFRELTKKLEEELGVEDVTVCTRSPLNGKLYPLRLQLPPNNATMHVVVVPTSSKEI
ncbi:Actin cross-linking protein [Abeliophyllum distichum]|uniref:Actin cross-linking protein n=1 Tax=Abeliophyllum distichum TaxID=126358 RepID=A0ABD1W0N2_9LAMI